MNFTERRTRWRRVAFVPLRQPQRANTTTTIHSDFLGSPVAETNSAGTVTRVERYTPYGEPADMQLDAGPGFTGHATDLATGLTYMQQRYYDAELGRFISPDPVGPEEDFIQHFNRYVYSYNNPVNYTDPDGRDGKNAFSSQVYDAHMDDPVFYNTARVLANDTSTGIYFYGGHANNSLIQDRSQMMATFNITPNDPKNLTSGQQIINSANGLKFGQDIFLAACNTGKGSLAQNAANINNSTVFAPNGFVSFQSSGDIVNLSVWSGENRTGAQGSFLKFSPGGSSGSISGSIKSVDVNMKTGDIKVNFSKSQSVSGSHIKINSVVIKKESK